MNAFAGFLLFEQIPSFIDEMRDVDHRERIGAFHDQKVAWRDLAQSLPGPERRQGAQQSAKIEDR